MEALVPASWQTAVLSSDPDHRGALADILNRYEIEPICAATISELQETLVKETVGLIFCDPILPDGKYEDLIAILRRKNCRARVVVTFAAADWEAFLEAMRVGAFDMIHSPCRPGDVEWMIIQAKRDDRKSAKQLLRADPPLKASKQTA